ncbi:MAG TPA: hypothetical protein VF911_09440, partial [Thermoanaerobaculia bacterium]
ILPRIGLPRRHHASGVSFAQRAHQRQLSNEVMRLALAETLGRAITDEEAAAIGTLWRGQYQTGLARLATRLSREAARGVPVARRLLVRRLVLAAARALRRGYVRDCVAWLASAAAVAARG